MPGTTPLGITYPCVGDAITLSALESFSNSTETAISNVSTAASAALDPNLAQLAQITSELALTAGVTGTFSFNTEYIDRGNMFNPATPTIIQLPANGSYLVTQRIAFGLNSGAVNSLRMAVRVNGVDVGVHKEQTSVGTVNTPANWSFTTPLFARAGGDQVTVQALYTGSGTGTANLHLTIVQFSLT